MILLTIFLEIILFGLMILFFYLSDESYDHEFLFGGIAVVLLLALFVVPMAIGNLHGYIDYAESNDKDKARITAVTQEQIEEERADLVKSLEDKGYEVVNTIFAEETPEGDAALFYLAKSIDAMSKVDAVIFMKGWENARGCKIEHEIAVRYNKFIKEL